MNRDVILLYWDIGRGIVEKQQTLGWGDSIVEMVSADLRQAFPGTFGFSPQNVWRMLQFFRTHTDNLFLSQAVRELEKKGQKTPSPEELSQLVRELITAVPWGHHANVLAKLTNPAARLYYLRATAQFGWSRNVLLNQIKASTAVIVAHNHPSGGVEPSQSDINITAQLKAAGEIVGIELLDHIIFNRTGYFRFLEDGKLK